MDLAIKAWLNGPRKYEDGADLYLQYGRDENLKRIFREPASDYKKKKLGESLRDLLHKSTSVKAKVEVEKKAAVESVALNDRRWPKERDATLSALHEKWKPMFAEMMNLMSRIYDVALEGKTDVAKKKEAGAMAHRILDLDDECEDIYTLRDHYLKHGRMPNVEETPLEVVVDPKKWPVALENCRRYVRQYKNKLKNKPDDVNAAKQLARYEWGVEYYMKQLNFD